MGSLKYSGPRETAEVVAADDSIPRDARRGYTTTGEEVQAAMAPAGRFK